MTVIAWDGKTLAADRRALNNYLIRTMSPKIRRLSDGSLMGCAGNADVAEEALAWYLDGAKPDKFPSTQRSESGCSGMIIITPDKRILRYEATPYPLPHRVSRSTFRHR